MGTARHDPKDVYDSLARDGLSRYAKKQRFRELPECSFISRLSITTTGRPNSAAKSSFLAFWR
jgi:hypothetical protein